MSEPKERSYVTRHGTGGRTEELPTFLHREEIVMDEGNDLVIHITALSGGTEQDLVPPTLGSIIQDPVGGRLCG